MPPVGIRRGAADGDDQRPVLPCLRRARRGRGHGPGHVDPRLPPHRRRHRGPGQPGGLGRRRSSLGDPHSRTACCLASVSGCRTWTAANRRTLIPPHLRSGSRVGECGRGRVARHGGGRRRGGRLALQEHLRVGKRRGSVAERRGWRRAGADSSGRFSFICLCWFQALQCKLSELCFLCSRLRRMRTATARESA